jgi:hypothetical protein
MIYVLTACAILAALNPLGYDGIGYMVYSTPFVVYLTIKLFKNFYKKPCKTCG